MGISTRRSARVAGRTSAAAASSSASPAAGSSAPAPGGPVGGIKKAVRKVVSKAKSTARAAAQRLSPKRGGRGGRGRGRGRRPKAGAPSSSAASSTITPAAAIAAVETGGLEVFPEAELVDDTGNVVRTKDVAAAGAFVVFLYPRANTPGCTTQACGFRDNVEELTKHGYRAFGLSYDSPKSQTNWKNKHSLPFPLWCDTPDNGLIKALGAHKAPKGVKRSHFIVAKGGKILSARVQITPRESIAHSAQFTTEHPSTEDAPVGDAPVAQNGAPAAEGEGGDAMDVEKAKEAETGDVAMDAEKSAEKDADVVMPAEPEAKKDVPMEGADPQTEEMKTEEPKDEVLNKEAPKADAPTAEVPMTEAPKVGAPNVDTMNAEAPKTDKPNAEAPNAEAPMAEAPKAEAPAVEAPKAEVPKVDGTKEEGTEETSKDVRNETGKAAPVEESKETVMDIVKDLASNEAPKAPEPSAEKNVTVPSAEAAQVEDPINPKPINGTSEKISDPSAPAAPLAS